MGSPPPMRGKVDITTGSCTAIGITPAYAGKSHGGIKKMVNFQDHPRLCGEKAWKSKLPVYFMGSPPPMRGKAFLKNDIKIASGITPAYAGKRQMPAPQP